MRILHVPHAYAPVRGGTEHLIQRIGETLAASGHEVRVLTTDVSDVAGLFEMGLPQIRPAFEVIGGVPVRRLPHGRLGYRYGARVVPKVPWARTRGHLTRAVMSGVQGRLTLGITLEVARRQPDVVVALPHLLPTVLCVLRARQLRSFPLAFVPLLHPNWPPDLVRLMAKALHQADSVIAVTEAEVEELVARYGVPGEKVFLAGIGVDMPQTPWQDARKPQVLYLGRKVESKRIGDLVEAMHTLWPSHSEATLVLAGARVQGTDAVDRMVADLPDAYRARTASLDDITDDEKARLLAGSRCLVLPSHTESFGIVLLEAMAHGTPVVAPDLPFYRSVVSHGVDGFLVDPSDPAAFAPVIGRLLDDEQLALSMGRNGREKVARQFGWNVVADRYLEAYRFAADSWARRTTRSREAVAP